MTQNYGFSDVIDVDTPKSKKRNTHSKDKSYVQEKKIKKIKYKKSKYKEW